MPDINIERLETDIQPDSVRFFLTRFNDRLVVQIFSSRIHVSVSDDLWIENWITPLGAWCMMGWDIQWWCDSYSLWDHDHDEPLDETLRDLLPQIQQAIEKALATK
jgi:hypothetical protein